MSLITDIVELGASAVRKGVAVWNGVTRISSDEGDVEPMSGGDVFQSLGVTSLPYPKDENGKAEGFCIRGAGGRNVCYIGARDTRSATIVGNLKPGDTVLHSTGPQQAAQVQCKEDKRQTLMASRDPNGKTMLVMLDGTRNTFEVVIAGMAFQFDGSNQSVTIANGKGASLMMQGDTVTVSKLAVGGVPIAPLASSLKTEAEFVRVATTLTSLVPMTGFAIPYVPSGDAKAPGTSAGG